MPSPLTLPIARIRATGAKVHTIIGHDPITTGSHPRAHSRWHYGIVLPDDVKIHSIEDALWRHDHSWDDVLGDAIAYMAQDGRILVQATSPVSENSIPREIRATRKRVECEVAEMLARIALVIESRRIKS